MKKYHGIFTKYEKISYFCFCSAGVFFALSVLVAQALVKTTTLVGVIEATTQSSLPEAPHMQAAFDLKFTAPHPTDPKSETMQGSLKIKTDARVDFKNEKAIVVSEVNGEVDIVINNSTGVVAFSIDNELRIIKEDAFSAQEASVIFSGTDFTPFVETLVRASGGEGIINTAKWVKTKQVGDMVLGHSKF